MRASLRSGGLPLRRGSRRLWRAASTSRGMSKIGSDTTWAKSRAKPRRGSESGCCGGGRLENKLACQDTKGDLEMKKDQHGINPASKPSGDGCVECLASPKSWWLHLRRCAQCGHIGCCDSSPSH